MITKAISVFKIAAITILSIYFIGCRSPDKYNERNYRLVKKYREDGYELYAFKYDTARKMLKYYWDNDSVQAVSYFYEGKRDGMWKEYFENGKLSSVSFFKKDLPDSTHTLYYFNGKPARIERYKEGKKVGIWEYFDTTGEIMRSIKYD